MSIANDNTKLTVYMNHSPLEVLCRTGGWTVIQSRGQFGNAPDFFYKTWVEYQSPFGIAGTLLNKTGLGPVSSTTQMGLWEGGIKRKKK